MADKIQIKSAQLRAELENEATADAALGRYYDAVTDDAFTVRLALKPEYEIEYAGEERIEAFGGGIMDLANGFVRWRRKKKYQKMIGQFPGRPRLVAEGDSWFQHPLVVDTIDHLTDGHGYPIRSLDAAGATLQDMVDEDEYLDTVLAEKAKALLLSGGGNDLMGERFADWIKAYTPGAPGQNPERFMNEGALGPEMKRLADLYDGILANVEQNATGVLVLVHTYDYVRPRVDGKWLGKPMVDKGITNGLDMDAVIRLLIGRFAGILKGLGQKYPAIVRLVDNIGTVPAAMWYDEIHPSDHGFVPVAGRFKDVLVAGGLAVANGEEPPDTASSGKEPVMAAAEVRALGEDPARDDAVAAVAQPRLSGTYRSTPVPGSSRVEELRLDVDGANPQLTASGTVRVSPQAVAHWIAALTADGPRAWSGSVWHRRGPSELVPHSQVAIRVETAADGSPRSAAVDFSGAGPVVTRAYRHRSRYFHPVNFEFDVVEGERATLSYPTCSHPNHPPTLACETLTIQTAFRRAGFDVSTTSAGPPVPLAGAGVDALWSDQEMHDAMQAYWSRYSSRAKWALWVFFASLHVPDDPADAPENLGGVMFDDIGPNYRQGTAIFTDSFIAQPPPGDPDPAAWVRRMTFWCACHEMGHAFNLAHSWQKALGTGWIGLDNEPEARSFMNYPYYVSGGLAAFFDDFEYRFSDSELLFMRHAPAEFVRMGDAAWFDDHGFEGADASRQPRLELALRVNRDGARFEFMEPVTLELKLTNVSGQPQLVDERALAAGESSAVVVIKRDGRPARQFVPYARYCRRNQPGVLDAGASVYESLFVSAGRNGWDIAEPGFYSIQMALNLGGEDVVSNPLELRILPPAGYDEEYLAQDFFGDDVGRIMALDGSRFLERGNDVLREVSKRLAKKRVALHAQIALGKGLSRDSKQLVADAKDRRKQLGVAVTRADLKEARRLLSGALCERADDAVESLGHVDFKWYADAFSRWLAEQGDPEPAAQVQEILYKALSARHVGGRKVLGRVLESVQSERDAYRAHGKGETPPEGRSKKRKRR